jgi:hypothetical protein
MFYDVKITVASHFVREVAVFLDLLTLETQVDAKSGQVRAERL